MTSLKRADGFKVLSAMENERVTLSSNTDGFIQEFKWWMLARVESVARNLEHYLGFRFKYQIERRLCGPTELAEASRGNDGFKASLSGLSP
jgi:hypothetical protein